MPRPKAVDDPALIARLTGVFRADGYDGASLTALAGAAGLKKASLYHRFPGGKAQMAQEALADAFDWFAAHVIAPLDRPGAPADRLDQALASLAQFYDNGRLSCLLNRLASPAGDSAATAESIRAGFTALTDAFARLATDAGHPDETAESRAIRAVALLQGSLVMARGLNDTRPFAEALSGIRDTLLIAGDRR